MKNKIQLVLVVLVLTLAVLSCQLPWEPETTPVGVTETSASETETEEIVETETEAETEIVVETETEAPLETEEITETEAPEVTESEEATPSLPVFPSPEILNIAMFTTTRGWAVTQDRNYLLFTADGGETWLDATPSGLHPLPSGITSLSIQPFFLDEHTAWFTPNSTTSGTLYHTQDSGVTWTATALPFLNARYFFLNLNAGFAIVDLGAGAGSHYVAIYRTMDGGGTWTEVFAHEPGESKSLPESGTKNGLTFLDLNYGWVGGSIPMTDYFHFYMTSDGGATWSQETDISLPAIYADVFLDVWQPFFMNNTVGYLPIRAMATDGMVYLMVYRSSDDGQTWTYQNAVQDGSAVDFYSIDGGWMAAGTGLFHTTDGGAAWSPASTSGIAAGEVILKVNFVDGQHGWVVTTPDESTYIPLNLYRTTDGGTTWTQLVP